MKWHWTLAVFAIVCLAGAAVWMGALNQDEGWYLYAASRVADGKMLYRDFQYTQGPLMPRVYSVFTWIWGNWGLLGARVFTLLIGLVAICIFAHTAADMAPDGRKREAALIMVLLLGCNLYHLYYLAIPKTYALASFFVAGGFGWFVKGLSERDSKRLAIVAMAPMFSAGLFLAFAAGTRISLGAILCVVGCWLLFKSEWRKLAWFCVGGFSGLALAYGPYLLDFNAFHGLVAAQQYHAARGGFDVVFTVGSFSRLVRWYLPVFIVLGLGVARLIAAQKADDSKQLDVKWLLLFSFLAVFLVQMLAPFPYEDYQVPIMGLLAVFATVAFIGQPVTLPSPPTLCTYSPLLVLGLSYAAAFGSPLLQEWMTNGQDRFWSLKKQKTELAQLREVARTIETLDPGGKTLLTQDTYLAVETGRKVPEGLEMGPFSILDNAQWKALLGNCDCNVAALSGYTFAVNPPRCDERPIERQMEYWKILRDRYELVMREEDFGQNATPLLILRRKQTNAAAGEGDLP